MSARLAVVAVAVVACLTACGGGHSDRKAVTQYLDLVDTAESTMAKPIQAVTNANKAFAKNQASPSARARLLQSERTLIRLDRKLAKIAAPPAARHLRALLLELVGREISLTRELYSLGTFVPAFETALRPMAPASVSLKKVLGHTAKGAAAVKAVNAQKAAALRAYATMIAGVSAKVRVLTPPGVWRPTYEVQLASLAQLRSVGLELAGAIEANRAAEVPGLLRRFDAAAILTQSVAAQRAQIAAVTAYDERVRSIASLARQLQKERVRLQRITG